MIGSTNLVLNRLAVNHPEWLWPRILPGWRERYELDAAMFPHSQKAYERMASLPIYTRMSDSDVERVITAVREVLRG